MATVNVREVTRKRLIEDMLKGVSPPGRWRNLVVDSASLKILNVVCKMHDIMDQNITLVENIELRRHPSPDYEAIYFLSPSQESTSALINDFSNGKPMYQAAHVFFTSALPERLFERIKRSGITTFLRKLVELNVDFLANENQVFTLDYPYSLRLLYNSSDSMLTHQHLNMISKKLVSVLATLGEYPDIRYYDPRGERRNLGARLSFMVQEELDNLCRLDTDFPPKTSYKRATLIVVDRGFDMMTPLLHEFTYQAMANDLLPTEGANRFQFSVAIPPRSASGAGGEAKSPLTPQSEEKQNSATVDESDMIWGKYRHVHIAEVISSVINEFQKFMEENPAARSAAGTLNAGGDSMASLKQMKEMVYAMPQFQESKSKYSTHINLCQECMAVYSRRKLEKLAAVEQDLVNGETAEGKAVKNIEVDMVPVLSDPDVSIYDKLRLLMLYIICKEGISDADRAKLLSCARLTLEDSQAITNLSLLGIRLSAFNDKKRDGKPKTAYEGVFAKERAKKKKKEEEKYVLSRWVPVIKPVLEDALLNKLDKAVFPYVKEPPVEQNAAATKSSVVVPTGPGAANSNGGATLPGQITSLRTTKPSWAKKTAGDRSGLSTASSSAGLFGADGGASAAGGEAIDLRKNGHRVIVFFVGGVTFSELRVAYELLREYQRDVIVGSSHILTPIEMVEQLKELHKPATEGRGGLKDPRWGGAMGHNDGLIKPRGPSMASGAGSSSGDLGEGVEKKKDKKGLFGKLLK